MSEVVDSFPTAAGNRKYTWENWKDGRIYKLERGVDFETTPRLFVHAAHRHAEEHRCSVKTRTRGDSVWLQFSARTSNPEPRKLLIPRTGRPPEAPPLHDVHRETPAPFHGSSTRSRATGAR